MNNPPVENETHGAGASSDAGASRTGSSQAGGHSSATAPAQGSPAAGEPARSGQQALAGPFGLRDVVVGASVLVMLVGSILPFFTVSALRFEEDFNLWNGFSLFFIGIGIVLPLVVAGLFAGRRLAPGMKPRIGSLSLDQFASVAAVLALVFFFIQTVTDFAVGPLIALIGALGLTAATTLAPHLPFFAAEFRERPEAAAAPAARNALPLRARPARPKTEHTEPQRSSNPLRGSSDAPQNQAPAGTRPGAAGATAAGAATAGATAAGASAVPVSPATQAQPEQAAPAQSGPAQSAPPAPEQVNAAAATDAGQGEPLAATTVNPVVRPGDNAGATAGSDASEAEAADAEPITATRDESESVVEAFWFAVGTPRQIVDERTGLPLFMFHPGDWELGLEDRGDEFLVQDKRTGRIGVLRDLSNIERVDADQ